jgi:hypothetical protein
VDRVIARGLKRYTAYTLTTEDRLRRSLAVVRLRCIAVSRWELQLGSSAVAAPVFGAGGRVAAPLEVRVRNQRTELPLVQPALLVAARSLSRELAMAQTADRQSNGWCRRNNGTHANAQDLEVAHRMVRDGGAVTHQELA